MGNRCGCGTDVEMINVYKKMLNGSLSMELSRTASIISTSQPTAGSLLAGFTTLMQFLVNFAAGRSHFAIFHDHGKLKIFKIRMTIRV